MRKSLTLLSLIILTNMAYANNTSRCLQLYEHESYVEANKLCLPLAQKGDKDAQLTMGLLYGNGQAVEESYPTAVEWLTKAANQGQSLAAYNLGNIYANGNDTIKLYPGAKMV